ncbi:hypothetical protein LCGC14_2922530, partial [marine sediment metagenome]
MRKFPLKDTPEFSELKQNVEDGVLSLRQVAEKLGMSYDRTSKQLSLHDIKYHSPVNVATEPVVNVPPIKIHKYKPLKRRRGDPETQVLLLGDHHADEITPSYNEDVYRARIDKVFKNTLTITELHRHMYPINDLVVFMLGDMVHGENPYQGAKVGTIKRGGTEQVYELAFPALLGLL